MCSCWMGEKHMADASGGDIMACHQLVVVVKGYMASHLDVENRRKVFSYRVTHFGG